MVEENRTIEQIDTDLNVSNSLLWLTAECLMNLGLDGYELAASFISQAEGGRPVSIDEVIIRKELRKLPDNAPWQQREDLLAKLNAFEKASVEII